MFKFFKSKDRNDEGINKEEIRKEVYQEVLDDMFEKGMLRRDEYEIEKSLVSGSGLIPYPVDSYVVMSGFDFRVPVQTIPWKALYDLTYYSDVLRTVVKVITDEVFRNGLYLEERFMSKCTRCEAEFEDVKFVCPFCGGVVRKPDERERLKAKKWLEKYVNGFEEKLIDVLKQVDSDINILDNGFIVLIKDYIYDKEGNLVGFKVKEVVRGSPLKMRLVWSKYGLGRDERGNYLYVCPYHREYVVKKDKEGKYYCDKCGRELLPAHYVQFGVPASKTQVFYAKGEVYHIKRWSNMQGYGFPPTLTVILKTITLLKMDRHMYLQYSLMRSPKGLLVIRGKENEIRRAWEWLMQKARENPNMIYPLTISGGDGAKKLVEWVDFNLKPSEMEWTQVREEFRRNIGCYDEETEVLVRGKGFVKYDKLEVGDEVLSFDKETGELRWKEVKEKYVYDYDGDMYHIKTRSYDLLVSPEHRLIFYDERDWRLKEKRIGEEKGLRGYYPQAGRDWKGNDFDGINVIAGRDRKVVHLDGINLMRFLGLYIAEGFRQSWKYEKKIHISQSEKGRLEEVRKIMDNLGLHYYVRETRDGMYDFIINNKDLFEWLEQFGDGAYNKHIPQWVKDLDKEYLEAFIEGYWIGDGNRRDYGGKEEVMRFLTASKKLADDLQEIFIKLGYSVNVYERGDKYYEISTRIRKDGNKKWYSLVRKEHIKKVKYSGKIWDINIGGGYFVVRRNGRVAISGNSLYGVMPVFQADISQGAGLNNEGLQITVTNRTVEESQRVWNEFLEWFSRQIGLNDWVLKLKPHEEKDMKAELDRIEQRIRIMQQLMEMGFEVELVEGVDGLDFRVKEGKPKLVNVEGVNANIDEGKVLNEMVNPVQAEKGMDDEDVIERAIRKAIEEVGVDDFIKKLGSIVDEYSGSPYRPRKRRKENMDIPEGSDIVSENTNKQDTGGGVSSSTIGTASEVVDNVVYGRRKKKEVKEDGGSK